MSRDLDFFYTLVTPSYMCFKYNLAMIGQAVSEEMFEYYGDIHVNCLGMGQMNPWDPFNQIHKYSVQIHFNSFPPFKCIRAGRPMMNLLIPARLYYSM